MLTFNIRRLIAWSPGLSELPKASAASSSDFSFHSEQKYVSNQLSPAQSRRFSDLTKTTADIALRLTQGEESHHIVFSSRHGELVNSFQLLNMIGNQEVLSPTLFTQSVHNTAIGAYSLIKKTHSPTTSLGAGRNSFMMGLVSSWIYLKENPLSQVLFISGDEAVPATFSEKLIEKNVPYATAMLLSLDSKGQKISFSMESVENKKIDKNKNPQTVEFLEWFFSESSELKLIGDSLAWMIKR